MSKLADFNVVPSESFASTKTAPAPVALIWHETTLEVVVPTVVELGYPMLELEGWNGVFAPAKTPKEIIDRLNKEIIAAVRNPELAARLNDMGAEPVGSTPAEQTAIFKKQMDQFRGVIKEMKMN